MLQRKAPLFDHPVARRPLGWKISANDANGPDCALQLTFSKSRFVDVEAGGAAITKFGIFAATILAVAACGAEAWAADPVPSNASPPPAASTPKTCTGAWDFIETGCQLTWYGITVYGTIDAGVGWQSHGATFDPRSAVSASYLIQRQNRSAMWGAAPNALSQSIIGIKGTEPIGGNTSLVFALDAGFDPYSFRFSDGPGSVAANAGTPLNLQSAHADSSRAGQFYNGQGYVGVSSSTYGTLTVFRQNSLTLEGS